MKVIQKDYKLDGWKLDYVASQFVRGEIISISEDFLKSKKVIKLETKSVQDINIEDYIHIELCVTMDTYLSKYQAPFCEGGAL